MNKYNIGNATYFIITEKKYIYGRFLFWKGGKKLLVRNNFWSSGWSMANGRSPEIK